MAGTLTRLEMVNEVLDNTAKSATAQTRSQTLLTAMVVRYLNRAQLRIARREDLLFCIATANTAANQKDYALPTDIRAAFSLRLENGTQTTKLEVSMPWDFDGLVPKPDESTTGQPTIYIPYKTTNTFELFKIPDAVYTMRLRYSFWPAVFASDIQTSDYTYMDDVLIYYATAYLFFWLQEYGDAKEWMKLGDEEFAGQVLAEREAFPDWAPKLRGFNSGSPLSIGEYYNDPFISKDV